VARVIGGTLTVAAAVSATNFEINGSGTLDGAGTFTMSGNCNFVAGTLSGMGILNIPSGATLTLGGVSGRTLQQRTVNIAGSATWNATAGISSGQGAVINIQSGGSLDIQNDQTLSFNLGGTATQLNVLVGGTLTKSAGVATSA